MARRRFKRLPLIDLTSGPCVFVETAVSDSSSDEDETLEEYHTRRWPYKHIPVEIVNGTVVHHELSTRIPRAYIPWLLSMNSALLAHNYIISISPSPNQHQEIQWEDTHIKVEKVNGVVVHEEDKTMIPCEEIRSILEQNAGIKAHEYMTQEIGPRRQYTVQYANPLAVFGWALKRAKRYRSLYVKERHVNLSCPFCEEHGFNFVELVSHAKNERRYRRMQHLLFWHYLLEVDMYLHRVKMHSIKGMVENNQPVSDQCMSPERQYTHTYLQQLYAVSITLKKSREYMSLFIKERHSKLSCPVCDKHSFNFEELVTHAKNEGDRESLSHQAFWYYLLEVDKYLDWCGKHSRNGMVENDEPVYDA